MLLEIYVATHCPIPTDKHQTPIKRPFSLSISIVDMLERPMGTINNSPITINEKIKAIKREGISLMGKNAGEHEIVKKAKPINKKPKLNFIYSESLFNKK